MLLASQVVNTISTHSMTEYMLHHLIAAGWECPLTQALKLRLHQQTQWHTTEHEAGCIAAVERRVVQLNDCAANLGMPEYMLRNIPPATANTPLLLLNSIVLDIATCSMLPKMLLLSSLHRLRRAQMPLKPAVSLEAPATVNPHVQQHQPYTAQV